MWWIFAEEMESEGEVTFVYVSTKKAKDLDGSWTRVSDVFQNVLGLFTLKCSFVYFVQAGKSFFCLLLEG